MIDAIDAIESAYIHSAHSTKKYSMKINITVSHFAFSTLQISISGEVHDETMHILCSDIKCHQWGLNPGLLGADANQ
jgi:hypothetical protein